MNLFLIVLPENILILLFQNANVCRQACGSLTRFDSTNTTYSDTFFQESVCSPQKIVECVDKIPVDTSSCIKPCSGLIVTSLFKSEKSKDLELLYPRLWRPYNNFKKNSTYPPGLIGIINIVPYLRSNICLQSRPIYLNVVCALVSQFTLF